jgi:hypothetical protein
MTQNTQPDRSAVVRIAGPRNGQRFSDRLERRRGYRDAISGRSPASMAPSYAEGYAEGRRRSPRRRRNELTHNDGSVPRPSAWRGRRSTLTPRRTTLS